MKRDLPGAKPSRLLGPPLSSYMPDEFKPKLPDIMARNQFTPGTLGGENQNTMEPLRITGVTVGGNIPGASVAVSATADGRTVVSQTVTADAHGNAYAPAFEQYIIPPGTPITTSGGAKAIVDVEYYVHVPKAEPIKPHGRARIIPWMRRFVEEANASIGGVTTTTHQGMGRAPRAVTVDPATGFPVTQTGPGGPGAGPNVGKGSHSPKYPGKRPGGGGPRPPRGR